MLDLNSSVALGMIKSLDTPAQQDSGLDPTNPNP